MKLLAKTHNVELRRIASEHGAKAVFCSGYFIDPYTLVIAETLEQMRDILNDYCRAKIDAKNIEAGQPMWADAADKAQERRP